MFYSVIQQVVVGISVTPIKSLRFNVFNKAKCRVKKTRNAI